MSNKSRYEFHIQFPAISKQNIQVGEVLTRLGRRKSNYIIEAMYQYIQLHPELLDNMSGFDSIEQSQNVKRSLDVAVFFVETYNKYRFIADWRKNL